MTSAAPPVSRLRAYGLSLGLLALLAWPATWDYGDDSFPLSPYPMFAKPRAEVADVATVLGIDRFGLADTLTPELIGGSSWVNLAARRALEAVMAGEEASEALCHDVAARVADHGPADVVRLVVLRERFDTAAYFQGHTRPLKRIPLAECRVPR